MVADSPSDFQHVSYAQRQYEAAQALHRQGRLEEAERHYRAILKNFGEHTEVLLQLGEVCIQRGKLAQAVEITRRAAAAAPQNAATHSGLGNALGALNRHEEAVVAYRKALALEPNQLVALNNLGRSLNALGRHQEALDSFKRALAIKPNFAPIQFNCGKALAAMNRHEDAIIYYRRAVALDPLYVFAYNNIGLSLNELNRPAEALCIFDRALSIDPNYANSHIGRGIALQHLGRFRDARAACERALVLAPEKVSIHGIIANTKDFHDGDSQLAKMEALVGTMSSFAVKDRIDLHFALAKAYDDLKRYKSAFEHLRMGNALKRETFVYDEADDLNTMAGIASLVTREWTANLSGAGNSSDVPVFVLGMPRSGTSLVEQMLASHPCVFGSGETNTFARCYMAECPEAGNILDVRISSSEALNRIGASYMEKMRSLAPSAARIVDKSLSNIVCAGLIRLALPNARLIHIGRDPRDTCFSCYSKLFARNLNYAYDLGELGRYYKAYEALMAHWRAVLPAGAMLEVQYEELVDDFEAEARKIVEYCGLEWDARCLSFHKTERSVHTASAFQVRQPLFKSGVGRARPYAEWLGPLREALDL